MPLYEYDCPSCEPFTDWRSMSESSAPATCPACGGVAERILSACGVGGRARSLHRPRGVPEPSLVKRELREPPRPDRSGGPPKHHHGGHTHGADRPWMIGH